MKISEAKRLTSSVLGSKASKEAAKESNRNVNRQAFLSDEESQQILLAFMRGRTNREVTEEEAVAVVNEIIATRVQSALVDLAVKGLVDIDYRPDATVGDRLVFKERKDISDQVGAILSSRPPRKKV